MSNVIKQISSLEKIGLYDKFECKEIKSKTLLKGERFSYQIVVNSEDFRGFATVDVESPLKDHIKLYREKEVNVDIPFYGEIHDEGYLIEQAGCLPDLLVPIDEYNNNIPLIGKNIVIWVRLDLPKEIDAGNYSININFTSRSLGTAAHQCQMTDSADMSIEVIDSIIPEQSTAYARWLHVDCIANAHNVEVYSEEHWSLIDEYIGKATDMGINMILVPIHTPPLDTEIGTRRRNVQLVKIEKIGDTFNFGFEKLKRFIDICKKHNVKYYEMAHLFSQWGAKFSPNIAVSENGVTDYMFGWHIAANSGEYVNFLKQYIKALYEEFDRYGITDKLYFHVSDEPALSHIDNYTIAHEIIAPYIKNKGGKTIDALSHYEFYERGLVDCPVSCVSHIHDFLDKPVADRWVYYYCDNGKTFTNSFIASPSARVRILGFQMYKYGISGFLQWGFNFYNSNKSIYPVDPHVSTSADGWFPSGDAFIVYPSKNGAYGSIRGEVTYEAMQDISICEALEKIIGKEAVIKMIDEAANRDLRFDDYPRDSDFINDLRDSMVLIISQNC